MAVNLIIDGQSFELQGAASEETLGRLLEKIEGVSGSNTENLKKTGKELADMAKSGKAFTLNLDAATDKVDTFSEELDEAAEASRSFTSKMTGFLGKLVDGASSVIKFGASTAGVGMNLEGFGKNVEGLASHFKIVGPLAGAFGGAMIAHSANLQDTFRGLSSTGAMFSNSFFELERVAANSHISLAQMTSLVRSNSEALQMFGGSARLGAKRFSEILLEAQRFRGEFRNLGLSGEDAADMLMSFTAANARNSAFTTLTTQQQAAAGANFAKEMTLLASLTGQDRKILAQDLAVKQRRADVEMKLSRMDPIAQTNARAIFETIEKRFGANSSAMEAFRAKFLGQGVVIGDPAANMLLQGTMPLGVALNEVADRLNAGNLSIGDFVKAMASQASAQEAYAKDAEQLAPFNDFSMNVVSMGVGMRSFTKMAETVANDFGGNFDKFLEASNQPKLDKASQAIVATGMLAEDIGKTTRLLFNSLTEDTITVIADGVNALKDALANATPEELSKFTAATTASTGALSGFSKIVNQIVDKFKGVAPTVGNTIDDATKVVSNAATGTSVKPPPGPLLKGATSVLGSFLKKLPYIGAALTGGVTAAETGSVGEGIGAGGGSLTGGAIGATIGMAGGPLISVLGGIIGSFLGEAIGQGVMSGGERFGSIGKLFNYGKEALGFEDGGIVRQPTLAMIGEGQSNEAVIPLQNNRNVPVNMDMSAIEKLAQKIDRLADASTGGYDPTMTMEMRKFNRNAEKMVRLLQ